MIKDYKILAVSVMLFFVTSLAIHFGSLQSYLNLRLFNTLFFVIIFMLCKCYKHKFMTIILLLMVFFDVFALNIEAATYSKIAMMSRGFIYSIVILTVFKKLKFSNASILENTIYGSIVLLNFGLLYMLINMVEKGLIDQIHKAIIFISCVLMVLAGVASANYNATRLHKKSILFMIFTYSLAFSDIIAFCGFYLDYPSLFYYERVPAISAGYCLILYTVTSLEIKRRPIPSQV